MMMIITVMFLVFMKETVNTSINILFMSMMIPAVFYVLWKMTVMKSHILMLLLFLEILMLSTLAILTLFQPATLTSTFFMTYFTLAVCEASFGLGILINMARNQKNFFLTIL